MKRKDTREQERTGFGRLLIIGCGQASKERLTFSDLFSAGIAGQCKRPDNNLNASNIPGYLTIRYIDLNHQLFAIGQWENGF